MSGIRSPGGLSQEGKNNNSEVQPKECYFGRELCGCLRVRRGTVLIKFRASISSFR